MKILLRGKHATHELAVVLGAALSTAPRLSHARVIALTGELGSGKTTFTQSFGKFLGVNRRLLSPTFALRSQYKTQSKRYPILEHFDWYRLKGIQDLSPIGWKEALNDPARILIIEWPERARRALPKSFTHIKLAHTKEKERSAVITFHGK